MSGVDVLRLVCDNGKLPYGIILILSQMNTELWKHLQDDCSEHIIVPL